MNISFKAWISILSGAFILGVTCGAIQYRQNNHDKRLTAVEKQVMAIDMRLDNNGIKWGRAPQ